MLPTQASFTQKLPTDKFKVKKNPFTHGDPNCERTSFLNVVGFQVAQVLPLPASFKGTHPLYVPGTGLYWSTCVAPGSEVK